MSVVSVGWPLMTTRRLDDRIRELCTKVASSRDVDYEPAIAELKAALHEHTSRLRQMVADHVIKKEPPTDRRKVS